MDYDDYSYDEQSYGYDDQYDSVSYHNYGEENNDDYYGGYDNTDFSVDHEVTEVFPSQDDASIGMKPCDWDPYSSDDDVIYNTRHVATMLPHNTRKNKIINEL